MFDPVLISPSILSADFMNMESEIANLERGGAGLIHVDVMDGHFVPNLTIGVPFVKQLKKIAQVPLDVHLMIDNPLVQLPWYLEAGSDIVTVHAEAFDTVEDMKAAITMIKAAGAQASLSIKPKTPVEVIEPVFELLDMVLIMSVEPGFSGQSYIAGSEGKVAQVAAMAQAKNHPVKIEVDGGIGEKTAALVCAAGADVLVCGNAVCAAPDPAAAITAISQIAAQAQR